MTRRACGKDKTPGQGSALLDWVRPVQRASDADCKRPFVQYRVRSTLLWYSELITTGPLDLRPIKILHCPGACTPHVHYIVYHDVRDSVTPVPTAAAFLDLPPAESGCSWPDQIAKSLAICSLQTEGGFLWGGTLIRNSEP